jgi:hypothetical protein
MNHKLKGRYLVHGDITKPVIILGEFSPEINLSYIQEMIADMNHGHKLLHCYKNYRDNYHINNIVSMLGEMESIFHQWDKQVFLIKRETHEESSKTN